MSGIGSLENADAIVEDNVAPEAIVAPINIETEHSSILKVLEEIGQTV